jgi:pyrroloquinoline quinone biosynthesis protein E
MKRLKAFCHLVELINDVSIQIAPIEAFVLAHCTGAYTARELCYIMERTFEWQSDYTQSFLRELETKFRLFIDFEDAPVPAPSVRYAPQDFLYQAEGETGGRYETPVDMTFILTHRCNFRCVYCYNSSGQGAGADELSTEQWISLIEEARDMGVLKCTLTGGEPLVHQGFFDILGVLQRSDIITYICTNGSLITEEVIRKLKDLDVPLIQISLDSPVSTVHDAISDSRDSFLAIIKAIRTLVAAGIKVYVKSLMLPETAPDVGALIDLCHDAGVSNIILDRYDLCYNGRGDKRFFLSTQEEESLAAVVAQKRAAFGDTMLINLIAGARNWRTEDDVFMCGGFMNGFTVSPEGDFPVCEKTLGIPSLTVGNFKSMSLREMWRSSRIDVIFSPPAGAIREPCLGCECFASCRTGCFAAKRFLTDDYYSPDPKCWKADYSHNPFIVTG